MGTKITTINMDCLYPKTLTGNFEEFLLYKQSQGNCLETERQYRYHYNKFIELCEDNLDIDNLKQGVLKVFAKLNGKSNVSYNMVYKYLHCFFNWCVRNKRLPSNPIRDLEFKKKKEKSRAIDVKSDIIVRLINSFDLKTYSGFRNYVLILTTLDTGARPNELLNITKDDVNFKSKQIIIREEISKTHEKRVIPISNITVDLLQKLIFVTPKEWNQKYVFCTSEGNQFTSSRWTHVIYYQCEKLEIKITAYGLRHIFAITFLRNKGNIFALQRILGHSDLSMTKKYIELSEVDIEEEHLLASPVNNFVKRNTKVVNLFK